MSIQISIFITYFKKKLTPKTMPEIKEITQRVFELMKKHNVTGYKLMKDLNIPEGTISQIKKGKFNFTIEQLIKISDYFNVSLDWLCKGIEESNSDKIKIKELTEKNFLYESALKKYDNEIMVFDKIKKLIEKTNLKK